MDGSVRFREAALASREKLELALREEDRLPVKLVVALAAATFTAILAMVFLVPVSRTIQAQGVVEPEAGVVQVRAPMAGTVSVRAHGGEVDRDQALYELVSLHDHGEHPDPVETLRARIGAFEQARELSDQAAGMEIESLRAQAAERKTRADLVDVQASVRSEAIGLLEKQFDRVAGLVQEGHLPPSQRDQVHEQLLAARAEWQALLLQRRTLLDESAGLLRDAGRLEVARQRARAEDDARLHNEAERLGRAAEQEAVLVRAPLQGTIAARHVVDGQQVAAGTVLATVVPSGSSYKLTLLVPSGAAGYVTVGDPVIYSFPAFPQQRYGRFRGVVGAVSLAPTGAREASVLMPGAEAPLSYVVEVEHASDCVRTERGCEPLRAGMAVEARVVVGRMRLYEWLAAPLSALSSVGVD